MRQTDAGHWTRERRDRLAAGEVPDRAELRELIAHLARRCSTCCALIAPLVRPSAKALTPIPENRYEFPIARAIAAAKAGVQELEECRRLARVRLGEILTTAVEGSPAGDALRPPLGSSPVGRWAWCEALIEAVRGRRGDPLAMLEIAEQAVELSDELVQGPYPEQALADLQAKAHMEYGNRLRVVEDLWGAERELADALRRAERGTGDPLLLARLADLQGSLYRDKRRIPEALRVLDLAARLYHHLGELHGAGRVLVKQGATLVVACQPEEAIEILLQALELLDCEREPALHLVAEHNLIYALAEANRAEEAWRRLWSVRALSEQVGTLIDRIKLVAVEATIVSALGQPRRAERLFRSAKADYERQGLEYLAAITALDLAAVLLEQGRPTEVPGLLDQALATFRRLGIEREVLIALTLLRIAAEQRTATAALVRDLVRQLRHREVRERREPT